MTQKLYLEARLKIVFKVEFLKVQWGRVKIDEPSFLVNSSLQKHFIIITTEHPSTLTVFFPLFPFNLCHVPPKTSLPEVEETILNERPI